MPSQLFATPRELYSLLKFKFFKGGPTLPKDENLRYCYEVLIRVSRSFAAVICELPKELRDPICLFYLVLRALDTVEDDTKFDKVRKVPLLKSFHEYLEDETFKLTDCGEKDYKDLLLNWHKVAAAYKQLDDKYKVVIKDITQRMGEGMAEYIDVKNVDTIRDYNRYCYYVAGLVGLGLSEMFVQYGETKELRDPSVADIEQTISNQMGLFLQKTNIIRDYHEDIVEDRIFWPKEVWSKYATTLEDFAKEENIPKGVHCLNELITDALDLMPACVKYMSLLKDREIFNFCAIPQVMAIATMAEIYNNPDVFRKNVKIRKGMAAQLILQTKSVADVERTFFYFADKIEKKIDSNDPNAARTRAKIQEIKRLTAGSGTLKEGVSFMQVFATTAFASVTSFVIYQYRDLICQRINKLWNKNQ